MHVNNAVGYFVYEVVVLVLRELCDISGGHRFDHLHVARKQCGNAGGRVGQHFEGDFVPRFFASPVTVICFEDNTLVWYVLAKFVGARTDCGFASVIVGGRCFFAG